MTPDRDTDRLSADDAVTRIIGEFFERLERGESCAGFAFVAAHPLAVGREDVLAECRKVIAANALIDSALAPEPDEAFANDHDAATFTLPGFEVFELLGSGGMGSVYRGKQRSLGREVALKVIRPDHAGSEMRQKMFAREADALAKLQTPHIVPVIDVLPSERGPVLVMGLIKGPNLGYLIRRTTRRDDNIGEVEKSTASEGHASHPWHRLSQDEFQDKLAGVFEQVLTALTCVHAEGLVHRDIKPSNILLDERDTAWLSDFGLVQLELPASADAPESAGTSRTTMTGRVPGTYGFIAPEVAEGQRGDAQADLFSLGAAIYEAFTGVLPYGRRLVNLDEPPPTPPSRRLGVEHDDRWRQFDDIVLRALAAEPANRFRDAPEMLAQWRAWRASCSSMPVQNHRRDEDRVTGPGRRMLVSLIVLIVLFCLLLPFLYGKLSPTPSNADPVNSLPSEAGNPGEAPTAIWSVRFQVDVPDAEVVFMPLDPRGMPVVESPHVRRVRAADGLVVLDDLKSGDYLVEAGRRDVGFHQVYRRLPRLGEMGKPYRHLHWETEANRLTLHRIDIVPKHAAAAGMALFPGVALAPAGASRRARQDSSGAIDGFYLDTTEVTFGEFLKVLGREHLLRPAIDPMANPEMACTDVTYDVALAYAELVGKRLPSSGEYLFAATSGGRMNFPWGDTWPSGETTWNYGSIVRTPDFDRTSTEPPVYGLMSNAAEWLCDYGRFRSTSEEFRVVHAASFGVVRGAPETPFKIPSPRDVQIIRVSYPPLDHYPRLGFRCARSSQPLLLWRVKSAAVDGATK